MKRLPTHRTATFFVVLCKCPGFIHFLVFPLLLAIYILLSTLTADTKTPEHATILMNSLLPDRVLFPERANRTISVKGSSIQMFVISHISSFITNSFNVLSLFTAVDVKQLRTIISGTLDLLKVAYRALALDELCPR